MIRASVRGPRPRARHPPRRPRRLGDRCRPGYPRLVLAFERQVVGHLMSTTDPARRAAVEAYVDGTLRSMPEHLRAGVAAESVLLGAWARLRRRRGGELDLDALDGSPVDVVRQYVRLLRGLVLFAESELAPAS
jgi:hypothetical protein